VGVGLQRGQAQNAQQLPAQRVEGIIMTDMYVMDNETWKVTDDAEQCPVCDAMSYIFSNRFGPYCCIGCSDTLASQMTVLKGVPAS
jgi:hypothetical protein